MSEPVQVAETPDSTPAASDFAAFEAAENKLSAAGEWPAPAAVTSTETPAEAPAAAATTTTATDQTDKGYTPPKPGSRRTERRAERDQEHINETIRKAVTEATEATERRLRAEFEAKQPKAAEPAAEPVAPVVDPNDPKPVSDSFDNYDDFIDARADWRIRQSKRESEAASERTAAETRKADEARDAQAKHSAWEARRDAFTAAHPDRAAALDVFLGPIRAGSVLGDALLDSDVGPELADYLASYPDEAERIARLSPVSALRALGKLETLFSPTTSASASSAGPAAKHVTTAPAPPTTLAARTADLGDPVASAVARGDYSAFEREENRRAVAR